MKKQVFSVLLCLVMICTLLPMTAFAAQIDTPADVDGSKTASPTELSPSSRITTVTLSLPSAEYKNEVDIVFVMDKSSSTANNNIDFSENVMALLSGLQALNTELKINVGIIKFRGYATDAIRQVSDAAYAGLTQYTANTAEMMERAIEVTPPGSGTNLHGALALANDWLASDTGVADGNKYVIVLTDGKSYIWNNDHGEATTNYTQYYNLRQIQKNGMPTLNQQAGARDKAVSAYTPYDPQYMNNQPMTGSAFWFDDYADLYASNNPELSGTTEYDQYCYYAYGTFPEGADSTIPQGTVTPYETTNGEALFPSAFFAHYRNYYAFTPAPGWENVRYFEANPYQVIYNEETDTYTFDADSLNEHFYMLHPDCLQKGLYKAGHLWSRMHERYHCGAVIYDGWGSGAGLSVAKSFCAWLKNNSAYGANINSTDEVAALFDSISTEITYLIGSGTVTDVIADDFDLVAADGVCPFVVTVAGEVLPSVKLDGEADQWGFGHPISDEATETIDYPYEVTYVPDNDAGETIIWNIHVPVENAKPVTLSYDLRIREDAAAGEYDTNASAELSYTSTNQQITGRYSFERPKVLYAVPTTGGEGSTSYILTLTKVDADHTGLLLRGAKFELYRIENTGDKKIGSYTTDSNGEIRVKVPDLGNYYWVETMPPTGYTLDTTKHYTSAASHRGHITVENRKTGSIPSALNLDDHYAYIIGYPDGLVHPEANINRAEVASIFFRLLKENVRSAKMTKSNSFSDVKPADWYCTAVSTMAALGVVKGYPNGSFGPNGWITRAEFAAIAARFDNHIPYRAADFSDISGHWAAFEICRAAELGWINGYPHGTFKPDQPITRAEAMAIVNRVLNRNPKAPADLLHGMTVWPDNMDTAKWYYLDVQEATNSHDYGRRANNTEYWTKINGAPDWSSLEK